jgi:hypothetical protein
VPSRSGSKAEFAEIAPRRDTDLAQPGQTLESGHQVVDRFAATEHQELELVGELGEVRHQGLGEHVGGDTGGLLGLQISVAIRRHHNLQISSFLIVVGAPMVKASRPGVSG